MNARKFLSSRRVGAFLLGFALAPCFGQTTSPVELVLKGKVRDFVDTSVQGLTAHPHFYGSRPVPQDCNAQQLGINSVQLGIDTTDDMGDTARFQGDNRGPKLISPLDPRMAQCIDPVGRFKEWYNDRPSGDINRAFLIDLHLTRNPATGMYEYFEDSFFPIDSGKVFTRWGSLPPFSDRLSGPDGAHNFGFTMEIHAKFTYFKGKNQVFNFRGDDDVWVFFNGKRAIDLGGIHNAEDATVNLDAVATSIGLQDSGSYPLDFFFAERHASASHLRITTSLLLEPQLPKPMLPAGHSFKGETTVTLTDSVGGVIYYYTTDGSTPTSASQQYAGPVILSSTTTLKVIAVKPGWRNSEVAGETYTRMDTIATPIADPPGRIFATPLQVSLSVATPGAIIRYTVNGTDPDSNSAVYTRPLTISANTNLKARAFLANWVPSAVMTENYTDANTLVSPVANPPGGGFVGSQTMSLSVPGHPDAQIHYTLDGTEPTAQSPLYAEPLVFTTSTTLKARAFRQDWKPSAVMTEVYTRLAAVVRAVYVDFDGNGRIEGALIRLDIPVAAVPSMVRLVDPFTKAPLILESSQIVKGPADDILVVRFPDRQFSEGTAFPPDALGSFPNVSGFGTSTFIVADSAGPVPVRAVSHNKTRPEEQASVDVTFSEPINLAEIQAGNLWPFAILRNGAPVTRPVQVASVVPVDGRPNTYRFTFEAQSPAWPVYIDSLVLAGAPLIHDAGGAPGVPGGKKIPVEGEPRVLTNNILIQVTNPIVKEQIGGPSVVPDRVRQNPFAVVSGPEKAGTAICLNCPVGTESLFNPGYPLPEWIIRTKYAVSYAFSIFDQLGNFVSKTDGRITEAMIANIPKDPYGYHALYFRWIPVARNGNRVGTGAYILKGVVANQSNESQKGLQGEDQIVTASSTNVLATFGYLRQF